jgi:hypothetical protein
MPVAVDRLEVDVGRKSCREDAACVGKVVALGAGAGCIRGQSMIEPTLDQAGFEDRLGHVEENAEAP